MAEVIVCPNCGQKNRIGRNQGGSHAICAKCWALLNPPNRTSKPPRMSGSRKPKFWKGILAVSIIGAVVLWAASSDTDKASSRPGQSAAGKVAPKVGEEPRLFSNCPGVAMPVSGEVKMYTDSARVAPLEIKTSRGVNYLVKLVSISGSSERTVMTIFAKGGETISTAVPLGTYELRYAAGEKWCGYEHHYKHETNCCYKADKKLTFAATETQFSGYTVTLYRVPSGNLSTSRIPSERF